MSAPSAEQRSLGASATSGMTWLMLQSVVARGATFVGQLVLAALLMPEDFGKIGLANTILLIALALSTLGLDDVLLQRKRSFELWCPPAFWLSLGTGLAGALAMLAVAPFAARLFGVPDLLPMIQIAALSLPLAALSVVPMAALRADLRFRFLAQYNALEVILLQGAIVGLVGLGFGVYGFVIPVPLLAAARAIVLWSASHRLPPSRLKLRSIRYMVADGGIVYFTRIILACVAQAAFLILGLLSDTAALGIFYFAYSIASQPIRVLAGNVQNVILPVFMRIESATRQGEVAIESARALAIVVFPLSFLQAALIEPVLRVVFGGKWDAAIPIIQILSVGLSFDAIAWVSGAVLSARGEFRLFLVYTLRLIPLFLALAAIGAASGGAVGIAIGVAIYYAVGPTLFSWRILTTCGASDRTVAALHLAPLALSAACIGGAYAVGSLPALGMHPVLRIGLIGVGTLAYVASVRLALPEAFDALRQRFRSLARRSVRPPGSAPAGSTTIRGHDVTTGPG